MSEIPGMMSKAAKRYFLSVLFAGDPAVEELWVGLARRPPIDKEVTLQALAALEPRGAEGYARQALRPENWVLEGDTEVVSKELTFMNAGDETWPPVEVAFLATSRDDSGVLIAWSYLQQTRVLFKGDYIPFPFRVRFPD